MKQTRKRKSAARVWILLKQLSPSEKAKLLAKLEKENRQKRWDSLVEKMSRRFRNNPISDEEITQVVEEVRRERYERSQNRS